MFLNLLKPFGNRKFLPIGLVLFYLPSAQAENETLRSTDTPVEITVNIEETKKASPLKNKASTIKIAEDALITRPGSTSGSLVELMAATIPSVVRGGFGKIYLRGAESRIQYQINGFEIPESASNDLGEIAITRNLESIETTEGALPAEYGGRATALVQLKTKSPSNPSNQTIDLNYGSFNSFDGALTTSGTTKDRSLNYYLAAGYLTSERGLDTPQPVSLTNQKAGGRDIVHDRSVRDDQLLSLSWKSNQVDHFNLLMTRDQSFHQIPNYPASFLATDPFFQPSFTDQFGNSGGFNYTPATTDDSQRETHHFVGLSWKHTTETGAAFSLQGSWKISRVEVHPDLANDLAALALIPNSNPSSFSEDKTTQGSVLLAEWVQPVTESHTYKLGSQLKFNQSTGTLAVTVQDPANPPALITSREDGLNTAWYESLFIQDEFKISEKILINAGFRFDSFQYSLAGSSSREQLLQPRFLINYVLTDKIKVHGYYGKLFQPAAVENLHDTFTAIGGGSLVPYDIKPEKDDYFEVGLEHLFLNQTFRWTIYDREATDLLDDAQLLNTSLSQPFNYARGYERGIELAVHGPLSDHIDHYLNYAYASGKGQGLSGGLFAFQNGTNSTADYRTLDHTQLNTANAGLTWHHDSEWKSLELLYGSGLPTGPNNSSFLPEHLTLNVCWGNEWNSAWLRSKIKISADVINVFDQSFPIFVANGFNGSYYSAGRTFAIHFKEEL